jgi:hypothetical protein
VKPLHRELVQIIESRQIVSLYAKMCQVPRGELASVPGPIGVNGDKQSARLGPAQIGGQLNTSALMV